MPQSPVPDGVGVDVGLAFALERQRSLPALEPGDHERQLHGDHRDDRDRDDAGGSGPIQGPAGQPGAQRRGPTRVGVGHHGAGQHKDGQRQHEQAGIDLETEADREDERRPERAGPQRQPRPAGPRIDPCAEDHHRDGAHRRRDHRQLPVVERVEDQRRSGCPEHHVPAGQQGEQDDDQDPEGYEQDRGLGQELGVGVGAAGAEVHEQSRQHRVLDHASEEHPVVGDAPVDVGEHVVVDVAADPQELQVGIAGHDDLARTDRPERTAAGLVERGAAAGGLAQVAEPHEQ